MQGVTLNDVIVAVDGEDLWGRFSPTEEAPIRARVYAARQGRFRELRVATDLGLAYSVYRAARARLPAKQGQKRPLGPRRVCWPGRRRVGPKLAETAWQRGGSRGGAATAFVWRLAPCWPFARGARRRRSTSGMKQNTARTPTRSTRCWRTA